MKNFLDHFLNAVFWTNSWTTFWTPFGPFFATFWNFWSSFGHCFGPLLGTVFGPLFELFFGPSFWPKGTQMELQTTGNVGLRAYRSWWEASKLLIYDAIFRVVLFARNRNLNRNSSNTWFMTKLVKLIFGDIAQLYVGPIISLLLIRMWWDQQI